MHASPPLQPAPSRSPAVTRSISILRYLGEAKSPVGVNAMARDLGLVPSTCLHILRALEVDGLVQSSDVDHRYSLSSDTVRFARHVIGVIPGVQQARPLLRSLSERFRTSVALLHLGRSGRSTVLAAAHPVNSYGLVIEIGRRFPVHAGASGRCVVAHSGLSREQAEPVFGALKWSRAPSFEDWWEQVDACAVNGYATDDGHYLRGFVNVAVPVFRDGVLWRTVASVGARGQLTHAQRADLTQALVEVGTRLSAPD